METWLNAHLNDNFTPCCSVLAEVQTVLLTAPPNNLLPSSAKEYRQLRGYLYSLPRRRKPLLLLYITSS